MPSDKYVPWLSGIAALLGVWIIAVPFVWSVPDLLLWSNVVAGAAIAVLAGYGAYRAFDGDDVHPAIPGVAVLAGLWAVAAPFVAGSVEQAALASNVVSGVLVAVLAGYGGYAGSDVDATLPGEPTA